MVDRQEENKPKSLLIHAHNALETQATYQKISSYATEDQFHPTVLPKLGAASQRNRALTQQEKLDPV